MEINSRIRRKSWMSLASNYLFPNQMKLDFEVNNYIQGGIFLCNFVALMQLSLQNTAGKLLSLLFLEHHACLNHIYCHIYVSIMSDKLPMHLSHLVIHIQVPL